MQTIPVQHELVAGNRVIATIQDVAFGGEGVARLDEFVIFVPFTAIGEQVEAELIEVKKRFARARLVRILTHSAERVTPLCPYFGECGGCQYQHLSYTAQLRLKQKQLADLLQRIGRIESAVVEPVVPCSRPFGYRNRIMVRSQWDKVTSRLNIGFLRQENRLVVDVEECRIAEPLVNDQLREIRAHPPPKGGIKSVLRVTPESWEVPHDSFFQNNFHMLSALVETVRRQLQSSGARYLVDAYCGVGFFSVESADMVDSFIGIEFDARAVQAARMNASRRGRKNGEYLAGRTEDLLPRLLQTLSPEVTTVLLDPPRTGCPAICLELLRSVRPRQIIYVSCHPATLARDLKDLSTDGLYRTEKIIPLDMFPQTQHIECVADLRLGTGPAG
jgi:tRNA/tmRNA/rRNA uracil-C5-methylase (TrmA/RlmC/RlmD family)